MTHHLLGHDHNLGSFDNSATVDEFDLQHPEQQRPVCAMAACVAATAEPIPTASEWGLMLMGLMLAVAGLYVMRTKT